MFLNGLIFRDRKEFNKFLEYHTIDGKEIDISSFNDMPECVKNLTINNDVFTLSAATFFISEELDIEARPITKEEILNYVDLKKLKKCYQRITPEDIVDRSKNYALVMADMTNRGFSSEEFYEYGRSAFESLICYNAANYYKWIKNSFGISADLYHTNIDKEAMKIIWESANGNCLLMVTYSKAEAYYRTIDELGFSRASEIWIAGDDKQYITNYYDVFPNPIFRSEDTDILKAFLSGEDIKAAKRKLGY